MLNFNHDYNLACSRIITDESMVDPVEDWSGCRSPSRAKRRRARGFRGRMKIVYVPQTRVLSFDGGKMLVMHPEIQRQMRQRLSADASA